jgi:hypothetical protein
MSSEIEKDQREHPCATNTKTMAFVKRIRQLHFAVINGFKNNGSLKQNNKLQLS